MTAEVVVSRYGEDLSWLSAFPPEWIRTVYDKSLGGQRDDSFRNEPGPRAAKLWPRAIRRPNVGHEAETYLHHVATRYGTLSEYTVFLQGDAPRHIPDIVPACVAAVRSRLWFAQFGPQIACDRLGRPHHPEGLPELKEMADCFGLWLPPQLVFRPWALFVARRASLQDVPAPLWQRAEALCVTKRRACGMERLWGSLLGSRT